MSRLRERISWNAVSGLAGRNRALLANAGSMVSATVVNSLLGVAFWFVAAQHFSEASVGIAGAAVSAMLLIGFLASFGMGTLLMGELPRREGGQLSLLNAALAVAAVLGLAGGIGFAVIAPLVTSNLGVLDETVLACLAFGAAAGLTAAAYILDQALIGLFRGGLQLSRNTVFAAAKLAALIGVAMALIHPGAAWIYAAWGAGVALSMLVIVPFQRSRRHTEKLRPDFRTLHHLRRPATSHAALNLALETADLAMPVIVLTLLSPTDNAGFYIAWLVVGVLVMIPLSLSSVAYALGSQEGNHPDDYFRFTLGLSLALGVLANLVLIGAAGPILEVFGSGYADTATAALQILALGVFPLTIKTHYVAIHRAHRTLGQAMPLAWAGIVLELGGGALGAAAGGITGVAWGWLIGLMIEALLMGPDVLRAARVTGPADRARGYSKT